MDNALQSHAHAPDQDEVLMLEGMMALMGRKAHNVSLLLANASTNQKNTALKEAARALREAIPTILEANQKDRALMIERERNAAFIERAMLDEARVDAIAAALEAIAELEDPVGHVMQSWQRPNGLQISRVRTPLGVIGIIYESRPNVTADAGALSLKAGNACILRGGSDTLETNTAIHRCLEEGLDKAGLPREAIQLVPVKDREAVGLMLQGLNGTLDVIVPRGGRSLVERVQTEARVPVFAHLEGICHVYIDERADPDMAETLLVNAKMRRTSICGAAETCLIHHNVSEIMVPRLCQALHDKGCVIRGDETVRALWPNAEEATEEDWSTEYLDSIIAMKVVRNTGEAIDHINEYGSHHTDSIVTEDQAAARRFLAEVDSAIVMHNASTQFADGGEFGMGAEIGIATGRMHARGPVGVEQLTSFKYVVEGQGQIRP
jgi:glutamate-5-semialdehyde dehydrogenase